MSNLFVFRKKHFCLKAFFWKYGKGCWQLRLKCFGRKPAIFHSLPISQKDLVSAKFFPRNAPLRWTRRKTSWFVQFFFEVFADGKVADSTPLANSFSKNMEVEPGSLSTRPAERSISREKFGRNQIFLTYGQWVKNCWFPSETFQAELSTPHSICPEKSFETKVFFSKKISLTFFSDLEWKNSGFVEAVFNKGVKNKFRVTRGSFR